MLTIKYKGANYQLVGRAPTQIDLPGLESGPLLVRVSSLRSTLTKAAQEAVDAWVQAGRTVESIDDVKAMSFDIAIEMAAALKEHYIDSTVDDENVSERAFLLAYDLKRNDVVLIDILPYVYTNNGRVVNRKGKRVVVAPNDIKIIKIKRDAKSLVKLMVW